MRKKPIHPRPPRTPDEKNVCQTFFSSALNLCVKKRYIRCSPGRQTKKTSERQLLRRFFRLASEGAANVSIFHTQAGLRRKKRLADVFFVWRPGGAVDVSFLWFELEAKFKSSVRALSLRQFPAKANMVFVCIGLGLLILPRIGHPRNPPRTTLQKTGTGPASPPSQPAPPWSSPAWPSPARPGWPGLAWPGLASPCLAWPGLAWPDPAWPGLAWPGLAWPWPGLAWPGLAWSGLAWTGLAWKGLV